MLYTILSALISYLLGSIPFAIIITRLVKGVDVREYGSKNAGATNVYRVAGLKVAMLVGLLDLTKGFVAVFFVTKIFSNTDPVTFLQLQIICAIAVVLGHMLTIFASFKGGKGVLAAAGAFLALLPAEVGIAFGLFIIIVAFTRYVSLGSISAAAFISLAVLIEKYLLNKNIAPEKIVLSVIITIVVVIAHSSNIKRLISGNENKVGKKS